MHLLLNTLDELTQHQLSFNMLIGYRKSKRVLYRKVADADFSQVYISTDLNLYTCAKYYLESKYSRDQFLVSPYWMMLHKIDSDL